MEKCEKKSEVILILCFCAILENLRSESKRKKKRVRDVTLEFKGKSKSL